MCERLIHILHVSLIDTVVLAIVAVDIARSWTTCIVAYVRQVGWQVDCEAHSSYAISLCFKRTGEVDGAIRIDCVLIRSLTILAILAHVDRSRLAVSSELELSCLSCHAIIGRIFTVSLHRTIVLNPSIAVELWSSVW